MNIFYLDDDPKLAAKYHCNKHVVKMILETAQLLCSAYHMMLDTELEIPYKLTHKNHPSAQWVRESKSNFDWLCELGLELSLEYTRRYGKRHKTETVIEWCINNSNRLPFEQFKPTPIKLCMPDKCKINGDPVQSYRNYYKEYKSDIVAWDSVPIWWG